MLCVQLSIEKYDSCLGFDKQFETEGHRTGWRCLCVFVMMHLTHTHTHTPGVWKTCPGLAGQIIFQPSGGVGIETMFWEKHQGKNGSVLMFRVFIVRLRSIVVNEYNLSLRNSVESNDQDFLIDMCIYVSAHKMHIHEF